MPTHCKEEGTPEAEVYVSRPLELRPNPSVSDSNQERSTAQLFTRDGKPCAITHGEVVHPLKSCGFGIYCGRRNRAP
jgi:hypothetical protein